MRSYQNSHDVYCTRDNSTGIAQLESFETNITVHLKMGNSTIFFLKIRNFFLTLRDICHIVNIGKSFIRVITMGKYLLERV